MKTFHRFTTPGVLAALLGLSGCIIDREHVHGRYDEQHDHASQHDDDERAERRDRDDRCVDRDYGDCRARDR